MRISRSIKSTTRIPRRARGLPVLTRWALRTTLRFFRLQPKELIDDTAVYREYHMEYSDKAGPSSGDDFNLIAPRRIEVYRGVHVPYEGYCYFATLPDDNALAYMSLVKTKENRPGLGTIENKNILLLGCPWYSTKASAEIFGKIIERKRYEKMLRGFYSVDPKYHELCQHPLSKLNK